MFSYCFCEIEKFNAVAQYYKIDYKVRSSFNTNSPIIVLCSCKDFKRIIGCLNNPFANAKASLPLRDLLAVAVLTVMLRRLIFMVVTPLQCRLQRTKQVLLSHSLQALLVSGYNDVLNLNGNTDLACIYVIVLIINFGPCVYAVYFIEFIHLLRSKCIISARYVCMFVFFI